MSDEYDLPAAHPVDAHRTWVTVPGRRDRSQGDGSNAGVWSAASAWRQCDAVLQRMAVVWMARSKEWWLEVVGNPYTA